MARIGARTIACTLLSAAVAAWALRALPGKLESPDPGSLLEAPRSAWEGALSLWHVSGWRTASGSRSAQLERAALDYEKSNPGLYVRIENISAGQFESRLAAGKKPDLITWPGGAVSPAALPLAPVGFAGTLLPALDAAVPRTDGGALALPWIWGGEVALVNAEMAERRNAAPPDCRTWTGEDLLGLAEALAHSAGKNRTIRVYGLAGSCESLLPFCLPGSPALPEDLFDSAAATQWQAWENFAAGRAGILLASQWEAAAMERLRGQGKGFVTGVLSLPAGMRRALEVQWIATVDSGNAPRTDMAKGYVLELLSERSQRRLSEKTGCPSVLPGCSARGEIIDLLIAGLSLPCAAADPLSRIPGAMLAEAARGGETARRYVLSRVRTSGAACENLAAGVE